MTMIPMYRKCPECRKKFLWNPDAGLLWCPRCGAFGVPGAGDIPAKPKNPRQKGKP
ncbi:MAG: hypothetical protein K2P63_04705 [Lachnospiraceae bacterium]|nr:hypothetical protein [Lachnospiraceae bacterium]